jgi:hypothetical protein
MNLKNLYLQKKKKKTIKSTKKSRGLVGGKWNVINANNTLNK